MISCILLTAGLSSRFHSPKALAKINGHTVVEHIVNTLLSTQLNEIIIVTGAYEAEIKPFLLNHKAIKVVHNKDYKFGQTSSFKVGVNAVSDESEGIVLLPVDYPLVQSSTIDEMIGLFQSSQSKIVIPTYVGKKGHPPLFSISIKDDMSSLDNDLGINTLQQRYSSQTTFHPVSDPGVIQSFNTEEEWERIKLRLNAT